MPGPSNILAARGFRLYKRAYNYKKVVSSSLNIEKVVPENAYQSPWRPSTIVICFQALAEINR